MGAHEPDCALAALRESGEEGEAEGSGHRGSGGQKGTVERAAGRVGGEKRVSTSW